MRETLPRAADPQRRGGETGVNTEAMQAQAEFGVEFTLGLARRGTFTLRGMHRSRVAVGSLLRREQERCPLVFSLAAQGSGRWS